MWEGGPISYEATPSASFQPKATFECFPGPAMCIQRGARQERQKFPTPQHQTPNQKVPEEREREAARGTRAQLDQAHNLDSGRSNPPSGDENFERSCGRVWVSGRIGSVTPGDAQAHNFGGLEEAHNLTRLLLALIPELLTLNTSTLSPRPSSLFPNP